MNIFNVAYYDIIRNFRDRKSFGYSLILPIILILILGTALNRNFNEISFDNIKVAYINKDSGEMSKGFSDFLEHSNIKNIMSYKSFDSLEEAKRALKAREVEGIIFIDEDFSKRLTKGEKADINIYSYDYTKFNAVMLENIVSDYTKGANAGEAVYKASGAINSFENKEFIEEEFISLEGKKPKAMDYYAVTMLVMIIMYGAGYGIETVGESYLIPVGKRISTTPIKPYENFIGKVIATVFTLSWQFIVLIMFSKLVYKANFGQNLPLVIFICLSLSVFATSLGASLTMVFKDRAVANRLISILVPIFTFISGGYFKIDLSQGSGIIPKVASLSPNYLAQKAIFNSIYGGSNLEIKSCIITLWIMSLVAFVVAVIAERWVEA